MHDIAQRLLSQSRKGWFKRRPVFERHRPVSATEIQLAEQKLGTPLPSDLRTFLLLVGTGAIDQDLSCGIEWLSQVEEGELKGATIFAQDGLGNFYAFTAPDERIVFFSRSSPEYAVLAPNFRSFMEELERRDYKTSEWAESLPGQPYAWNA